MARIGVTGIMGSGKTTVCRIFNVLGIPVYYADKKAKDLMNLNPTLSDSIKDRFGPSIYDKENRLNTQQLAAIVFDDNSALQTLNDLVHPFVKDDFKEWVLQYRSMPYVIKEAALFFETDSYQLMDKVVTVSAPKELCIARIVVRDLISETQIEARMDKQLANEEKVARSDHVIINDDKTMVLPQVLALHNVFLKL